MTTTIQDEREALAGLRVSADKIKEQNAQLETIETPLCPICEQPLTDVHRADLMERNAAQLGELRAAYGQLQKQIKVETEQLEETQQRLRSLDEKLRKLPRQSELDETTQALNAVRAEAATLQAEVESLADVPAQLQEVQTQLQALGNPREQAAVAQATADRRSTVEENRSGSTSGSRRHWPISRRSSRR